MEEILTFEVIATLRERKKGRFEIKFMERHDAQEYMTT